MHKLLTNRLVETVKPGLKRLEIRDASFAGFSLRVTENGRKTFGYAYRWGLEQRRERLGTYPATSLARAREKAVAIQRLVEEGTDPTAKRRATIVTVEDAVADFIRSYAKPRNKSWREAERTLTRGLTGAYATRDIRSITRADILDIVDAATARGALYQANRIHAHVRKFFNYLAQRGTVEANPILGISMPSRERARDRVLADDEVARIIRAAKTEPFPFGPYVLLLLATAQRRGELATACWSHIDLDAATWEIPAHLSKNGKPNLVPLSPFALSVLDALPRFEGSDLIFSTNRRTPISGFTKMLQRLSASSDTSGWRLHDLRRTAATGMARAGIDRTSWRRCLTTPVARPSRSLPERIIGGAIRRKSAWLWMAGGAFLMKSPDRQPDDTRTVREAMNRIGPVLFPDQWTGKEYLDHWRLGLNPWPPTKLRGMEAIRELLVLVWAGRVTVEVEVSEGIHAPIPAEQVFHFHGGQSLVGDSEEIYRPCRLRFPPVLSAAMTSKGGRNGYDYAPVVVRVLQHLDRHGPGASIDQVTNSIIADMQREKQAPPSYSRLQPYVSALRAYRMTVTQNFPESILETRSCDPEPIGR